MGKLGREMKPLQFVYSDWLSFKPVSRCSEVNNTTHILTVKHLHKSIPGLINLACFRRCSSALKTNYLKLKQMSK